MKHLFDTVELFIVIAALSCSCVMILLAVREVIK